MFVAFLNLIIIWIVCNYLNYESLTSLNWLSEIDLWSKYVCAYNFGIFFIVLLLYCKRKKSTLACIIFMFCVNVLIFFYDAFYLCSF